MSAKHPKAQKAPKLDKVTKAVAGAWFGMMRPNGESHLRFGLQQGRPTIEVERALNILEAHGMVSREPDEYGGVTYRPIVDMSTYRAAANMRLKLTEPVSPQIRACLATDKEGARLGVKEGLEAAAAICEARADYFDRAPGYRDWKDAARSYRATANEIRDRAALEGRSDG